MTSAREPHHEPTGGATPNGVGLGSAHWAAAYEALREMAANRLASIPRGPTFQPTDVLHEAFVRVLNAQRSDGASPAKVEDIEVERRAVATLAAAIRSVLVDRVRRRGVRQRHAERASFERAQRLGGSGLDLLALDEGLTRLARIDERAARVVELRYFAGLSVEHAATLLGVSTATAERDWRFARAWLAERLGPDGAGKMGDEGAGTGEDSENPEGSSPVRAST